MNELGKIENYDLRKLSKEDLETVQRKAFEVYFDYGITADYDIFDLNKIFKIISAETPRKIDPIHNIIYFKALQLYLKEFKRRKAEEKKKYEEEKAKVQSDIDFLKSVGVNINFKTEEIVKEIPEEKVPMDELVLTKEAEFFKPSDELLEQLKQEELIVKQQEEVASEKVEPINQELIEKNAIDNMVVESIQDSNKEKINGTFLEEVEGQQLLKQVEALKQEEINTTGIDSKSSVIDDFAASFFEEANKKAKGIIFNDESNSVTTDLTEFKEVDMEVEEVSKPDKAGFVGILGESDINESENMVKRFEEMKVDFESENNKKEENDFKFKEQDVKETNSDDPFIFGFTSIKK